MRLIFFFALLLPSAFLTAQTTDTVRLKVEVTEVTATEKIYDFIVADFENILAYQFGMTFDTTKIRFKEVRNILLDDMTQNSFNDPIPGTLLSVWLDRDFVVENYEEPTVIFQLVFEYLEPGNAHLCFSENWLDYEFVNIPGSGQFELSHVFLRDDCHIGLALPLGGTGTEEAGTTSVKLIESPVLTSDGTLSFFASTSQSLEIEVYDLQGRKIGQSVKNVYPAEVRSTITMNATLLPSIYLIHAQNGLGESQSIKVAVQ